MATDRDQHRAICRTKIAAINAKSRPKPKIANMTRTQTTDTKNNNKLQYSRESQFTYEIQILNKGLRYNLHHRN